jgi:tetratricopeptide (TPR) repeat protein
MPQTRSKINKSFFASFFSKKEVLSLKKNRAFLKKSAAKNFAPLALICVAGFAHADAVSAAVGRPLQRAEALIQAHNYHAALDELQQASHAGSLTAYERGAIAQLHGTAEAGAGNYAQAALDYQTVLTTATLPPASQLAFTQAIAGFYFQAGQYPQTITWVNRYIAGGGQDAQTRALLAQAYLEQGDYAQAEHAVQQAERNGTVLPQAELQLLVYSAQKAGDQAGYFSGLVALLQAYPSTPTWDTAITTVTSRPDFPDALTLDAYRLRRATGTLSAPGDYEDYTERAILAGQISEARSVIDDGFSSGILNTQTDNGHAARLQKLADSITAPAPAAPDPLQTGIAAYQAGQNADAAAAFNQSSQAPGSDAQAALARLWAVCARNAARKP